MIDYNIPALETKFDTIRAIMKGWYLPLEELYETKKIFGDVDPLSIRFAEHLPPRVDDEEKDFYILFFKMCITYLESTCNTEDKTLISIKKLSRVVDPGEEGISTFNLMMENMNETFRTKNEKEFWDICNDAHDKFTKLIPKDFNITEFMENVAYAIEKFLQSNHYSITEDTFRDSSLDGGFDHFIRRTKIAYLEVIHNGNE